MTKFGRIKRQHGRVEGLDALLDLILRDCPNVQKIVPGRMGRKRGNTAAMLRVQYTTGSSSTSAADPADQGSAPPGATGLKCIYTKAGSWQEVFLVCDDTDAARAWLSQQPFTK